MSGSELPPTWDELSSSLLHVIVGFVHTGDRGSVRLVCNSWRRAVDTCLLELQPVPLCRPTDTEAAAAERMSTDHTGSAVPTYVTHYDHTFVGRFTALTSLDLRRLPPAHWPQASQLLTSTLDSATRLLFLKRVSLSPSTLPQASDGFHRLLPQVLSSLSGVTKLSVQYAEGHCVPSNGLWHKHGCALLYNDVLGSLSNLSSLAVDVPVIGLVEHLSALASLTELVMTQPDDDAPCAAKCSTGSAPKLRKVVLTKGNHAWLKDCQDITQIELRSAGAFDLDAILSRLPSLSSVSLESSCPEQFDLASFSNSSSLTHLSIVDTTLAAARNLNLLTTLQSLTACFSGSRRSLIKQLQHLTALTHLSFTISDNGTQSNLDISPLNNLVLLVHLDVQGHTDVREFRPSALPQLESLRLTQAAARGSRIDVTGHPSLAHLRLCHCRAAFPLGVSSLVGLQTLVWRSNYGENSPTDWAALNLALKACTALIHVDLSFNPRLQMYVSLNSLLRLPCLSHLTLMGCSLTDMSLASMFQRAITNAPPWPAGSSGGSLSQPPDASLHSRGLGASLASLNLNSNTLTTLPMEISNLTALDSLHLCSNYLTVLPAGVLKLTWLKQLSVANNRLLELSEDISALCSLTHLEASGNDLLHTIPQHLSLLTNLRRLELCHNDVVQVAAWISCLTNLVQLDITGNKIPRLPVEMLWLTNLRVLSVDRETETRAVFDALPSCRRGSCNWSRLSP